MTGLRTTNRSILISGGSRGLGLYFCEAFLNAGNRVATFARNRTEAVDRLQESHGGDNFVFETLDATDQGEVERLVRHVARTFESIDVLINNAAVGQDELLVHTAAESVERIIATNLSAPILLTRIVLKRMLLQPTKGTVLNVSSICGSRGYPGLTVYSATKGALDAFTRSLAREVGEAGVRVVGIAPGFFESEMSSVLLPSQLETIRRRTPTGVLTTEQDVLAVADMLLADACNIQGQVIPVDGGITI
jgi:3-oxoacyl-[acyl-carrier protein] reductase